MKEYLDITIIITKWDGMCKKRQKTSIKAFTLFPRRVEAIA